MTLGSVSNGMIAVLVAVILAAGGFLWFTRTYQPAVAERNQAMAQEQQAQVALTQSKTKLDEAKAQFEKTTKGEALDPSIGIIQKARTAVPDRRLLGDAAIVLSSYADRAGIETDFKLGSAENSTSDAAEQLEGATGIDIEFPAVGTWEEMLQFMDYVESSVWASDGKLYTKGRLFNVVGLEIGSSDSDSGSGGGNPLSGAGDLSDTVVAGNTLTPDVSKGEQYFTVTVRMYTSTTQNSPSAGATTSTSSGSSSTTGTSAPNGTAPNGSNPNGTTPSTNSNGASTASQPSAATGGPAVSTDPAASTGSPSSVTAAGSSPTGGGT